MNYGTLAALLGCFGVVLLTILLAFEDPAYAVDGKSVLIVFGGTAMASMTCFPYKQVLNLVKVFLKGVLGKQRDTHMQIVEQIAGLSAARRQGKAAFQVAIEDIKHPFLREGGQVLFWTDNDISRSELRDLLETRAETIYAVYNQDANIFKTIAKFPPAFGLMGTTIGMIALLQSIGGEGGDNIGPAMSVALLTTLYGLILSNVLFIPLSEYLHKKSRDELVMRRMIIEGLMLIQERRPSKYVEEKVKSFLLPGQRIQPKAS